MGIRCGSQIVLCEYPIRFDVYTGCSHNCRYCFVQRKTNLQNIEFKNCTKQLVNFIKGQRNIETKWCDWEIPLHFGGMSDPFQPLEKQVQVTKKCLEIFAETKYPVIISTKGALCIEEPYISLLRNCNVVMQISAVCSSYDRIEQGAPTFEHRLKIIEELSKNVQRVIVRVQPYMIEVYDELCKNITKFKQAGAYGITIEGMKFMKKKEGLIRVGSDYCYPEEILKSHYLRIKELCKKNGLSFFCAENRLRTIGDSMACCGCGDIEGFNGNHFNCVTLINGEKVHATETMKKTGTGKVFNALYQSTFKKEYGDDHSFEQCMLDQAKRMKTKK